MLHMQPCGNGGGLGLNEALTRGSLALHDHREPRHCNLHILKLGHWSVLHDEGRTQLYVLFACHRDMKCFCLASWSSFWSRKQPMWDSDVSGRK